ncbi:MAG: endonuclease/exonuclease/phosphatase family protein [Sulfitobacter sp.]|nr:endonuclease/exonuclease/phosphatase family protein [Sulfitobacter sp.]
MEVQTKRKWLRPGGLVSATIGLGIAASLLGFLGDHHWTLDLFAHFRVQYLIGAIILLLLAAILRRKRSAMVAAFGLALNAGLVLPLYLQASEAAATDAPALKVLYANVLTQNDGSAALLQWIGAEDPDVIALLEYSEEWQAAMEPHLEAWPHRQVRPRDDNFGIAVYSRHAMGNVSWPVLTPTGSESFFASLNWKGLQFPFLLVHPYPPIRRYAATTARAQIEQLILRDEVSHPLALMVGDLNATPWSHTGRRMQDTDLRPARLGFGVLPTWPAMLPAPFRIPIDTVLTGPRWYVQDLRLGPDFGSDHLPLVAQLLPLPVDSDSPAEPAGETSR